MGKRQRKRNRASAHRRQGTRSNTENQARSGSAGPQRPGQPVAASPFEKPGSPAAFTSNRPWPAPTPASAQSGPRAAERRTPPPAAAAVVEEEEGLPQPSCAAGALAGAEPHGLAATYSFGTTGWTTTGPITIGFLGTRLDGTGGPEDRFERTERLDGLGPDTGKVTLTARLAHVAPGRWRIVAGPVENPAGHPLPRKTIRTSTQFALFAHGPGVRLFAWPALVGLGAIVAVIVQALLVARAGLPVLPVLGLSGLGCLIGFLGGKVWWLVVNRRPLRGFLTSGACVQGFLLAALAVLVAGTLMLGVSAGAVLDATAPGIFFGMAVGRPGCFLTGCCVGRPTASRWGLWSSDRRLGIRRIPVQLYEAAGALLIGVAGLALVLGVRSPFSGAVFVGTIAAYTLSRQFLFLLRTNSHTRRGRLVVRAICGVVLVGLLIAYLGI